MPRAVHAEDAERVKSEERKVEEEASHGIRGRTRKGNTDGAHFADFRERVDVTIW